jgi:hypothetical protein
MLADALRDCLAVVASLCLNTNADVKISWSTIWSGGVLNISGAKVTSAMSTDSAVMPNPKTMLKTCAGDKCVLYSGHCGGSAAEYRCKLWYSFGSRLALRSIQIEGTHLQVTNAIKRLQLVRSNTFLVRLDRLKFDASNDLPPI